MSLEYVMVVKLVDEATCTLEPLNKGPNSNDRFIFLSYKFVEGLSSCRSSQCVETILWIIEGGWV